MWELAPELPLSIGFNVTAIVSPDSAWAAAILAAVGYAIIRSRRVGLDERVTYGAAVIGIAAGLYGGHLLGVYYYSTHVSGWGWLRFWEGGQAQYGALIAGAAALLLFLRSRQVSILRYADAMAPAVALGVSIGRIGCFLNGDDFGSVSGVPWAVHFRPGTEAYADHLTRGWIANGAPVSLGVHPVQIYASILGLGLFLLLHVWRQHRPGEHLTILLIGHALGRFVEQHFRGDFRAFVGPLSLTQVISVLLVAAGVTLLARSRRVTCWAKPLNPVCAPEGKPGTSEIRAIQKA